MSDETNEILRQILDTQRQILASQQQEMERVAEFRISAMRLQKMAVRRQMIGLVIIAICAGVAITIFMFAQSAVLPQPDLT